MSQLAELTLAFLVVLQNTTIPPLVPVISLSAVTAVFCSGIAWGRLNTRVKAIEKVDSPARTEFNALRQTIEELHKDVREIRDRIH